jgi:hypothetical protein
MLGGKHIPRSFPRLIPETRVRYAGRKVQGGAAAVRKAANALGRTTSRKKVMARPRGR